MFLVYLHRLWFHSAFLFDSSYRQLIIFNGGHYQHIDIALWRKIVSFLGSESQLNSFPLLASVFQSLTCNPDSHLKLPTLPNSLVRKLCSHFRFKEFIKDIIPPPSSVLSVYLLVILSNSPGFRGTFPLFIGIFVSIWDYCQMNFICRLTGRSI